MSEVTKKMIVTKYALSGGVRCGHGRVLLPNCRYFKVNGEYGLYKIGVDAFDSATEALQDAESRRIKRIASLKKQIAKLEKLTFSVPDDWPGETK